ncbi:hypothetical protein ASPCAL05860 [Aspergillus calidoustus]|uniref:Uncharacterized protein n=1 Tax=Aspergillus calidoustus TaxID=454130 RepID=A0A0U5G5E0_ASPCI|nr:hypothetical protein ASPCAL05860 [Aspergillus calidoustus]
MRERKCERKKQTLNQDLTVVTRSIWLALLLDWFLQKASSRVKILRVRHPCLQRMESMREKKPTHVITSASSYPADERDVPLYHNIIALPQPPIPWMAADGEF